MQAIEIYADSNRGVYIPQFFADTRADGWHGISEENDAILKDGPDNEWYWDTWVTVLANAYYLDDKGNKYTLYHDGDLFVICYEKMTEEEKTNLFGNEWY